MKKPPAELALALDVPTPSAILPLLRQMPPDWAWFKVGLELFCAGGPSIIESLRLEGRKVFLDLKLHDIPRTVRRAVRAAAQHGAHLMTIHAGGGRDMIKAAAEAAGEFGEKAPRIVAVTALTSLSEHDLHEVGVPGSVADQVLRLGELAIASGAHGLVCSPLEVKGLRKIIGPDPYLVTPGLRSSGEALGDQKRTATAAEAVAAGSDLLVVGRPVTEAVDPGQAARHLLEEVHAANHRRAT